MPDRPVTVRSATRDDVSVAVPLLHAQLREHGIPVREEHIVAQLRALLADPEHGFALVAESEGAVAGVAYVTYARPLEHEGEVAWLEGFFVSPAARGAGIGGALVAEVCARAEARGCVAVDLEVTADHARAANLYVRDGFHPMKRTHFTKPLARWDWGNAVIDRDANPTGRFSDRAADYVKYRPSYPAGAFDRIVGTLGGSGSAARVAADVGAGTGISARLLAARGLRVIAVEPNASMRSAAEPDPRITWRDGTAEATGLDAGSVDLVVVAQAFHWFRAEEALREFARILRAGGRLALVWNRRSKDDPFTLAYRTALLDAGAEGTLERVPFDPEVLPRTGLFSPPERHVFPNAQHLDADALVGRAMSASYVPKRGPASDRLVASLRALHARFRDANGLATLAYETEVYLSEATR